MSKTDAPSRRECSIVFVMGAACCGKTTLIDAMVSNYTPEANPGRHRDVVGIHVGRVLRAKYGADAFRGQAAPEEFEREAIQLVMTSIENTLSHYAHSGRKLNILVDGQPRSRKQAREILKFVHGLGSVRRLGYGFLLVDAEHDERIERIKRIEDEAARRLAMWRLDGDYRVCVESIAEVLALNPWANFAVVQTDKGASDLIRRTLSFMESCEADMTPEGI